jgi:iron complex transport system ATP-binding protein
MTAMLRAQNLSVALGGTTVLHGVSVELQPGWTAIVGPNGAGKSTLLRALAGLLPRSAGQIWLQGRPLDDWGVR